MDLGVPVGTLIGAMAGLGSSIVVERARWSLGSGDRRHDALKAHYSQYLAALAKAVEQIWAAARSEKGNWRECVLTSMADCGVQEARFELSLLAGDEIVDQAEDVSDQLKRWRDVIADGATPNGPEDKEAWQSYYASRTKMLDLMRADLKGRR